MNLNLYDAKTGAFVRTLLNEKNNNWVEPEHEAFFPNEKSNNFVWFSLNAHHSSKKSLGEGF